MLIKQKCFSLILVLMLSFISCGEKIESTWKSEPIIVDGNGEEWSHYSMLVIDYSSSKVHLTSIFFVYLP